MAPYKNNQSVVVMTRPSVVATEESECATAFVVKPAAEGDGLSNPLLDNTNSIDRESGDF